LNASSLNIHARLLERSLATPYIPVIVFRIPHSSPFGGVQWLPRRTNASIPMRKKRGAIEESMATSNKWRASGDDDDDGDDDSSSSTDDSSSEEEVSFE
jgi:hypothetical protein